MKQYIKKVLWIIPFVFSLNLSATTYYFVGTVPTGGYGTGNNIGNWNTSPTAAAVSAGSATVANGNPNGNFSGAHTFYFNGKNVDMAGMTFSSTSTSNNIEFSNNTGTSNVKNSGTVTFTNSALVPLFTVGTGAMNLDFESAGTFTYSNNSTAATMQYIARLAYNNLTLSGRSRKIIYNTSIKGKLTTTGTGVNNLLIDLSDGITFKDGMTFALSTSVATRFELTSTNGVTDNRLTNNDFLGIWYVKYDPTQGGSYTPTSNADYHQLTGGSYTELYIDETAVLNGNLYVNDFYLENPPATSTMNYLILNSKTVEINNSFTQDPLNGLIQSDNNATIICKGTALIYFDQTNTTTKTIKTLSVDGGGVITLGNDVIVDSDISFVSGNVELNNYTLTLKGSVTNTSGSFVGSPSSSLICSTTVAPTLYFDQTNVDNYTLSNLTLANGASCNLGSDLTLSTDLNLGTGTLIVGSNTLTFSGTSTQPIVRSTGYINPASGTIKYAQTSTNGSNSLLTAAYSSDIYNLTLDFANGGTLIPDGSMTIGNSLTMSTANNYFNINGKTLTINGDIATNSGLGKFLGSNTSNLICSTANATLYFDQTSTSKYSLNSLTLSNSSSYTLGGNLIIADNIVLGTGNLNVGSNTLTFIGTKTQPISTTTGLINSSNATIKYAQTSTNGNNDLLTSVFSGNIYNLIVDFANGGILTQSSSLTIGNTVDLVSGTLAVGSNTLTFSGTATQTTIRTNGVINPTNSTIKYAQTSTNGRNDLLVAAYSSNIHNLVVEFANGGTLTPSASMTVGNSLTMNTANNYFNINGTTLALAGSVSQSGGKFIGSSSSNLICSTANVGSIYFDQTTSAASTLQNLTLANGASCTLGSNLILANGVDLGTSNLTVGSNTLTFAGSSATWITRNGGRINTTSGTIKYAQTSSVGTNHSIELAAYTSTTGNLNNLTIDFANACTFTPPSDMTIDGTLNLSGTNNTFVLNGTTLTVSGSVSSTGGKFKGSSTSNLNCSGTSSLYFDQTSASTKSLKNLKIQGNNANVTLANPLNIVGGSSYGSVEVTAASSTLSTGNNLTLKSDASGTARIANSPGTISGRYYAELYFPAKREYRFISAPVVGATALQWRNNGSTSGSSTSGVGIHISGTNGATDSFDATTANKPSAFYYDEPSAGSVTNINSTGKDDPGWKEITKGGHYQLTNGKGYRVLIRGDRNISLTTSNPAANTTTITSYGSYPRTSASGVTLNVTNSNSTEMFNGLNLIGNPYPSAIDWNTITRTNVDNGYTVYNFNNGGYDAWNGSTGDAGRYISAGQAVFVWCNNSTTKTGSLTINESDKYDGKGGSYFLEKLTNHLKINLMYDSVYNSNTFLHFRPDAFDTRDAYDIPQFLSNGTNIATLDPIGKAYKINSMLTLDSFTTIPLSVAQTPAAQLKLSFYDIQSFDGYKLELIDNYKKTKTELTEGFIYNFEITNDSFSQKNGRFYINFTRQPGMNNQILQNAKIADIYPNPVDTKLNIKLDSKFTDCNYVIYNSLGQQLSKGTLDNKIEKSINTKNYANGSYYIVLKSAHNSQTIQFIK